MQIRQLLISKGKLAAFSIMTLGAILIGAFFATRTGDEVQLPAERDVITFNVYVDDPGARVEMAMIFYTPLSFAESKDEALALVKNAGLPPLDNVNVLLKVTPSSPDAVANWIIELERPGSAQMPNRATSPGNPGVHVGILPIHSRQYNGASTNEYVIMGSTSDLPMLASPNDLRVAGHDGLSSIASIPLPFFDDRSPAGYAARLPRVEYSPEPADPEAPPIIAVGPANATAPTALVHASYLPDPNSAAPLPDNVPPSMKKQAYFLPSAQHTTEVLVTGDIVFSGSQITTLIPQNPVFSRFGPRWESDANLAPIVQTSNVAYSKEESSNDFYAGLAFATAAATCVAAVQEFKSRDECSNSAKGHVPNGAPATTIASQGPPIASDAPGNVPSRYKKSAATESPPTGFQTSPETVQSGDDAVDPINPGVNPPSAQRE